MQTFNLKKILRAYVTQKCTSAFLFWLEWQIFSWPNGHDPAENCLFHSTFAFNCFHSIKIQRSINIDNIQLLFTGLHTFLLVSSWEKLFPYQGNFSLAIFCLLAVTWMLDFVLVWRQEVTSWSFLWLSHCYYRCLNNNYCYLCFSQVLLLCPLKNHSDTSWNVWEN